MRDIARIIDRLGRARTGLQAAVDAVPSGFWREQPRPGAWSAAEVIAHLTMVEGAITDGAAKLTRSAPRKVPFWKRLHLPVRLAAWRGVRAKTPIPLDPKLVGDKEEMLARFAALRQRTLTLLDENRKCNLSAYRWPHPFFGSLNFYDWFLLMAYHELRHTKQIREIVDSFQS
jgi:hypothetical protein